MRSERARGGWEPTSGRWAGIPCMRRTCERAREFPAGWRRGARLPARRPLRAGAAFLTARSSGIGIAPEVGAGAAVPCAALGNRMQVAAAGSNALGECVEIGGRLGLELGLNQSLVNAGAVQRLGGLPCGGQRVHQGEREARGVRVRGHQPSPPVHGVSSPALRFGVLRELFQCPSVLPGQVDPLLIHPALELRRVAQVEAVQEGSAVELDGARADRPGSRPVGTGRRRCR